MLPLRDPLQPLPQAHNNAGGQFNPKALNTLPPPAVSDSGQEEDPLKKLAPNGTP